MKPTQVKELFANVRKTFVSFFSILMFVALGVGIFLGIYWSAPALESAVDRVFDAGEFHHVQIVYPYGLSEDDVRAVERIEGVDTVEATRQDFATYRLGATDIVFKLQTLGEDIDLPIVEQGELPVKVDEIALKAASARTLGLEVGDTITFVHDSADEDGMARLKTDTFKITGLVENPEYAAYANATYGFSMSGRGTIDALGWLPAASFDDEAYFGGYTTVNVRSESLEDMSSFSDEFKSASDRIIERIEELGAERAPARYSNLRSIAQTRIAQGEKQLEQLREGVELGEEAMSIFEAASSAVRRTLGGAIGFVEQVLPLAQLQGQPGLPGFVGEGFQWAIDRVRPIIDALSGIEFEFAGRTVTLGEGFAAIMAPYETLQAGRSMLEQGEADLAAGKGQLETLVPYDWTVAGRSFNGGYVQASIFAAVTGRLALSMAALFLIVGLLVTYSAVSRIVHEQIVLIGTKKALGLRGGEITRSFLAYSALAVVAGAVVGAAVGTVVVEGIISYALGGRFITGMYPPYFDPITFLAITALELVLVLGVTWLACRRILREHAVELLKGERPPEAKARFYEKWAIWEKLPLFTQTIVNNCVNDKRRVFSTIVGVAGCTALIVTAITLNDDVIASYDEHYDHVYGFDAIAFIDAGDAGAQKTVCEALEDAGAASTALVRRQNLMLTKPDGDSTVATAIVYADGEEFSNLYHVNVRDGRAFDAGLDGAWISEAYASHIGASVGDDLVLGTGDGMARRVRINGFYEYYLPQFELVMGSDTFEAAFDTSFVPNAILVDGAGVPATEMAARMKGVSGYQFISNDKASQHRNFEEFASISNIVVLVYLSLATLMAIVVLLNLNVMFIEEKKRELIVLMINGFSIKDAKRYVYNDTIVLTAIGIVVGLVLGAVMGAITVGAVEPESASFVKGVAWRAVVIGAVGTAVLSAIMTAIALRRIPRFDLTDINRF